MRFLPLACASKQFLFFAGDVTAISTCASTSLRIALMLSLAMSGCRIEGHGWNLEWFGAGSFLEFLPTPLRHVVGRCHGATIVG